jgi:hypothetical protein
MMMMIIIIIIIICLISPMYGKDQKSVNLLVKCT